ncbi:MAG: hypothetical protein HON23_04680 [Rickettsiales bacterium]|jgi:hypothetical protein|nr:hypothetical protein [Rickettsiales bacterium]
MDKELLKDILSVVRADKKKHKVEAEGQPVLSEVIYDLKYGEKNDKNKQLKSKERESGVGQAEAKSAKEGSKKDKKASTKKSGKPGRRNKKEIREDLKEEQVDAILNNISALSKADISSPELMLELEKLLLYKEEKALHQALQSNVKHKNTMSGKLNTAAFNLINNSLVKKEVER